MKVYEAIKILNAEKKCKEISKHCTAYDCMGCEYDTLLFEVQKAEKIRNNSLLAWKTVLNKLNDLKKSAETEEEKYGILKSIWVVTNCLEEVEKE